MIVRDGDGLQGGVWKAADHKSGPRPKSMGAALGSRCCFSVHIVGYRSSAAAGLTVLFPSFVPAQTLFDAISGLIRALISASRHALGFEDRA